MSPDSDTRRVHEAFTLLLRWAQRGDVRRALLGDAAPVLSPSDITLLRTIAAHGPVRASDLASWRGVDKSTVTPRIHRLEDHHLVARHGDPGDKRAALLSVTEAGRRKLAAIDDVGAALFGQALDGWSGDDRQALATLLQRLVTDLAGVPAERTPHRRSPA